MSDLPVLDPLDKRLNAWRADLAHIKLQGQVKANGFVEPEPGYIQQPFVNLYDKPAKTASIDTQMIHGEPVDILDERNLYLWVQSRRDGYVGWVKREGVKRGEPAATHVVSVARTFLYPGPDMKQPPLMTLSMGSEVEIHRQVKTRGTQYHILKDGTALIASHLVPVGTTFDDYVSVAEYLTHTPYLWAGTTAFGLDCSGLVQLAMRMAGIGVLRDSDMQAASIGEEIEAGPLYANLQRGDLIFWRGHVAICQGLMNGKKYIVHANGHTMTVASEPLEDAIKRIEYLYDSPIGFRRVG